MQNHVIMPHFIEIAQTAVEISQFLDFSKKVEPLHRATFRLNRFNPGRHIVIFLLFRMAAAAIFGF